MLLSRVAESVYWVGRYLERSEDTARLLKTHTQLYLDLPIAAGVGWYPLLAVTGAGSAFHIKHAQADEEAVVAFLACDGDHPGSIVAAVSSARTNLRLTRALFANESWHAINDFCQWMSDAGDAAIDRRTRLRWLETVVHRCQLLTGLLDGVMSHDEVYAVLEVGRYLERADMITRVLAVQAEVLLQASDRVTSYQDVTWMSVLRSVNAQQMFQRVMGGGVSGSKALLFLLKDGQFPRSVEFCLTAVGRALLELPRCQEPMAACAELQAVLEATEVRDLSTSGLVELVDQLQDGIAALGDLVELTYFPAGAAELLNIG